MVGRPAIYAPYPHAAENHQQDNAAFVVQHHAGWLMPDAEMTPQNLAALLEKLLSEPALMTQAAAAASTLAETNAAQRIAQLLEALG
jgi:UDP-N-acetylglucosamine--N-acetylmuramyl-(pentapeptide) pyrophosphoryl-undecaprenol N-acetylglucosamine transferase